MMNGYLINGEDTEDGHNYYSSPIKVFLVEDKAKELCVEATKLKDEWHQNRFKIEAIKPYSQKLLDTHDEIYRKKLSDIGLGWYDRYTYELIEVES